MWKHKLWVSLEPPLEAVLTCTHNPYFEQKHENSKKKKSTENYHLSFLQR